MDYNRKIVYLLLRQAIVLLLLSTAFLPVEASGSSLLGRSVSSLQVETLQGETVQLEDRLRGGPILLNFGATWCGPCRREWPLLDEYYRSMNPDSVSVLVLSVGEDQETVREHWKEENFEVPVAVVEEPVSDRFGVNAYPTNVIVGPYGRIVYRGEGFDSRIREILQSYSTTSTSPPFEASAMVPQEYQANPATSDSNRSSRNLSIYEPELTSDSPPEAFEAFSDIETLPELAEAFTDTTIRKITPNLRHILRDMSNQDKFRDQFRSILERDTELKEILATEDSSRDIRNTYITLARGIQSLDGSVHEALMDVLVSIPYFSKDDWEPIGDQGDEVRFNSFWKDLTVVGIRTGKQWRFNLPYEQWTMVNNRSDTPDFPVPIEKTASLRFEGDTPPENPRFDYTRQPFQINLISKDKGFELQTRIPALAGDRITTGEEFHSLVDPDYLKIKKLEGQIESGETIALQNEDSSLWHMSGRSNERIYLRNDSHFTLPDTVDLGTLRQLRGVWSVESPSRIRTKILPLREGHRTVQIGENKLRVVRPRNKGLVLMFDPKPESLWRVSAYDENGGPLESHGVSLSDGYQSYNFSEEPAYLRIISDTSPEMRSFELELPVDWETRTLELNRGEQLEFSSGTLQLKKFAFIDTSSGTQTHVLLSLTGEVSLERILGVTPSGGRIQPETMDWDIGFDKETPQYKLLRFDGSVRELEILWSGHEGNEQS